LLFQPRSRPLGRQARVRAGSQPAIPEPAVALRLVPPNTQTVSSRVALRKASATGVARIAALRNSSYPRIAGPSGTLSVVLAPSIAFVQYANLRGAAYGHVDGATHSGAGVRKPPEAAGPCHARALMDTSSGAARSAAAKLGWIIVGRWVVVVGPQTSRNGVIAIDPHATRSGVAWDHGLAGTNDDMLRFGMMPCCGGVRRSTQSHQKA
jgi:hypothetical protein